MIIHDKIIKDIIKKYFETAIIKKNDTIIIALSGGSDSMCLLDIFYKLSDVYKFKLEAIHIHHGIRGIEADEDLNFVEHYCKDFNISFVKKYVKSKDYAEKNSLTIEESARILRYNELHKEWMSQYAKKKKGNVYVAIAHHMRDQVETIIHNMLRGTGLRGIAGMDDIRDYIIRPLLYVRKEDIEAYIKRYDIPYVNDSTNEDKNYTRNYIRKEILDKFEKVNDKSFEHIIELSKQARETINYIGMTSKYVFNDIKKENHARSDEKKSGLVDDNIKSTNKQVVINLKKFRELPDIIKAGVIREVFNSLVSTLKDITNININNVIELSENEKGGHIDLPYNMTLDKKKDELIFILNDKNISMSRKKKK